MNEDFRQSGKRVIEDNIHDFVVGGIYDPLDGALDLIVDVWLDVDGFMNDAIDGDEHIEKMLTKFIRKGIDNMTLDELMTANELRQAYQGKFREYAANMVECLCLDEYAETHQKEITEELWKESQNPEFAQF